MGENGVVRRLCGRARTPRQMGDHFFTTRLVQIELFDEDNCICVDAFWAGCDQSISGIPGSSSSPGC